MSAYKMQKGLALLLSLLGVFLSFTLLSHYYGANDFSAALCSTQGGCDSVAKSPYSNLAGMPLALFGYLYFSFISVLFLHSLLHAEATKNFAFLFLLIVVACLIDIALFFIMTFVIVDFCSLCFSTYVINFLLLFLLFFVLFRRPSRFDTQTQKFRFSFAALREQALTEIKDFFTPQNRNIAVWFLLIIFLSGGLWANSYLASQKTQLISNTNGLSENEKKERDARWQIFLHEYKNAPEVSAQYLQPQGTYNNQKGSANAVLTIVEYSDFLCPYCKVASDYLKQVAELFGADVKIVHHNYPLDITCNSAMRKQMHQGSCLLAQAAVCAGEQKVFWPMYHLIFANQEFLSRGGVHQEDVLNLAKVLREKNAVTIDSEVFKKCLQNSRSLQIIKQEVQNANALGITGTPTVYFNSKPLGPFLESYILQKLVEHEKQQNQNP